MLPTMLHIKLTKQNGLPTTLIRPRGTHITIIMLKQRKRNISLI